MAYSLVFTCIRVVFDVRRIQLNTDQRKRIQTYSTRIHRIRIWLWIRGKYVRIHLVLRGQAGGRLPPPRSHNPSIEDAGIFHEYATNTALECGVFIRIRSVCVCVCCVFEYVFSRCVFRAVFVCIHSVFKRVFAEYGDGGGGSGEREISVVFTTYSNLYSRRYS